MLENEVLTDVSQSDWLRAALKAALACDPIRAANDAEVLACILQQRAIREAAPKNGHESQTVKAPDSIDLPVYDAVPAFA